MQKSVTVIVFAVAVLVITYALLALVRPPATAPVKRVTAAQIAPASPRPPSQQVPVRKSAERADLEPDPRTSLEPYAFGAPVQIDDGLTFGPEKAVRTRLSD